MLIEIEVVYARDGNGHGLLLEPRCPAVKEWGWFRTAFNQSHFAGEVPGVFRGKAYYDPKAERVQVDEGALICYLSSDGDVRSKTGDRL